MNLGPRQRRMRLVFGAIVTAVFVAGAYLLLAGDVVYWARLALGVPAYLAAISFLQAWEGT